VRLRFCGVRGSTPAPGVEFAGVGGHTSCVAVWPDGSADPRLVLDAGTGIRTVTALLDGRAFRGTILLSHLHWDHVQGLPFFAAADRDDARVQLLLPDAGVPAADTLRRAMSPPHFPIGPEGLRGRWRFDGLDEGAHRLEGLRVVATEVPHKGGRTFGYRVEDAAGSFAYVPDHHPGRAGPGDAVVELVAGVDLLVHDAQFAAAEAGVADAYGHATIDQAVALAAEGGVGELVLFHHSPTRTDAELAALVADAGNAFDVPFPVTVAVEGAVVDRVGPDRRLRVDGRVAGRRAQVTTRSTRVAMNSSAETPPDGAFM
jgi:ribonuclease BN (tRNA processing enzyme)